MKFSKNRKIANECPCGKKNKDGKFVPFEEMPRFGYCHACGKNFLPDSNTGIFEIKQTPPVKLEPTFIDRKNLDISFGKACENSNSFLKYIKAFYGYDAMKQIKVKYKIGNSKRWPGSTVFWLIDNHGRIRSGKVGLYNSLTGKRDHNCNDWIHSIMLRKGLLNNFNLEQCLFGLHLINGMSNAQLEKTTIAIVESAKTACIMSIFDKTCLWMSCNNLHGLKKSMLDPIKRCKILLYPDLGIDPDPFVLWSNTAVSLNKKGFDITVSDLVLKNATDEQKMNKDDIADFFTSPAKGT